MRKMDKIKTHQIVKTLWYEVIATRGYFDYWLDYSTVEMYMFILCPNIKRTFIHSVFWHDIIYDKEFLQQYEY